MNTFFRFFYEFTSIFFEGIGNMFGGIVSGVGQMLNITDYKKILESYKDSFNTFEWILAIITIIFLVLLFFGAIYLIISRLRKYLRLRKQKMNQDELLDEIGKLNDKVRKLMKEKDELMAMKVSQLGLKPGEEGEKPEEGKPEDQPQEGNEEDKANKGKIRFPKLVRIDERMKGVKPKNYNNNFTLEELLDNFRCFAATQLHLYYNEPLLRTFFGGLACSKLIILQGISGTG